MNHANESHQCPPAFRDWILQNGLDLGSDRGNVTLTHDMTKEYDEGVTELAFLQVDGETGV